MEALCVGTASAEVVPGAVVACRQRGVFTVSQDTQARVPKLWPKRARANIPRGANSVNPCGQSAPAWH